MGDPTHSLALGSAHPGIDEPARGDRARVKGSRRWEPLSAVAGTIALVIVFATTRARTLTEEDSANLARALRHYTVAKDQPHAPGYPLVVLVAHAFTWVGSLVGAYEIEAAVATVGTVLTTYLLGRQMFGQRAGIVAALIVCATPLALYYGDIVSVYPTESLLVPVVALLSYRVAIRADHISALLLFPTLAVAGGFRPTILLLMFPACVVGIVFGRPRARSIVLGALAAVAIIAAWAVPMVLKSGGWQAYRHASQALYQRQFSQTSIFYGASLHLAVFNAANALGATAMVALPALIVVVLALSGRRSTAVFQHPTLWITGAWLVPYLVMYLAIQLGKPGYVLAYLPLFAVLAGGLVASSPRAVPVAAVVAGLLLVAFLVLPQWPFPWRLDAFFPTAHAVHVQDEEALGLRSLAATCPAASCTIISLPTSRALWYHDPTALARWYAPHSRVVDSDDVYADRASLREVLWVGTAVPGPVIALATRVGTIGTWTVYRSPDAVTAQIIHQAFG
jgi:hypothetical protein